METLQIKLNDQQIGEIELHVDNAKAGKMDIAIKENLLTVYHTEVSKQYAGKGYAKLLLNKLVEYVQEHQLKIAPLCSYVQAQFKSAPEKYESVWKRAS